MSSPSPKPDNEAFRDRIATVDEHGKRVWIYPKKPAGRFYNARTYLSWVFLAILFGLPWIKVNGDPLFLFNILERRFILFGMLFTPQDFYLFGLAMITLVVFIVLFTVVFGRLFCGWVCPQTIFMEMVFRKIEYWIEGDANAQRRLNKAPWTRDKIVKKVGKHVLFYSIAVLIANTFLSYIIGVDEVFRIATEPVSQHLGGFIALLLFSFVFYGVFAFMREQVCIAVCPYGRLQGVMLDQDSIVVAYDFVRGEPRGPLKKKRPPKDPVEQIRGEVAHAHSRQDSPSTEEALQFERNELGDCIACTLCVQVCPTGIDIREGTQLECVNCTACIDACDAVMDKIGRPRGLIRYDSYNGIVEKRKKLFTPRVRAYSAVLAILLAVNGFLLSSRSNVNVLILRTPGMLYQEVDEETISNLYNYQVINKTRDTLTVEFRLVEPEDGRLRMVGTNPIVSPESNAKGALFVEQARANLRGQKNPIVLEVYSGDEMIDRVKTNFLGPVQ